MEQIEQIITTVDIAEMMEMQHKNVLKKIEGDKKQKGILDVLTGLDIEPSDYFIKSSYKDTSGKENPCYKCTRKGCEFLAHKFRGEKGIEFTARYIERFHQMESVIKVCLLGKEALIND